jgi:hypothetical protein
MRISGTIAVQSLDAKQRTGVKRAEAQKLQRSLAAWINGQLIACTDAQVLATRAF